jgi:hypothetical protein
VLALWLSSGGAAVATLRRDAEELERDVKADDLP